MEIEENNEEQNETNQSIEAQQSTNDNDSIIDFNYIDKVLIRNRMVLNCKSVLRTDGLTSDFEIINNLLCPFVNLDRDILKKEILPRISLEQMGKTLYDGVFNWLHQEGSILIVEYLPYLSIACKMIFHQCTIENDRTHGRVFVPVERNHGISTAIYYICDRFRQNIIGVFITDHSYTISHINRIHDQLLLQTDVNVDEKVQLYRILISEYIKQTENLQFHQHLLLLSKWQDIYKCYNAQMKLGAKFTPIESLGYFQCLIMLSKYTIAKEEIKKLLSNRMAKTDDLWYLLARAQRKRKKYSNNDRERIKYENYSKAKTSIQMAVFVNSAHEKAKNEQTIINKLIERRSGEETSPQHNIDHKRRTDDCLSYNILSIDGGGIRGIMAAIWLRELERKTKRTCSSMFQMMAGTSTGAIIAAGLSIPDANHRTVPAHDASKLVKLYETCGPKIFVEKQRHPYNPHNISFSLAPKYSSNGKKELFEHYFRNTLLYECLTDIVIPIVRSGDTYTHLFTRNDSLCSTCLVDVLMATTAAPTYLKPHCLNGTNYIDGGVQMNNPTMAAYTKAIEYGYDKENIFVLSLGTGDYIEDPLVAHDHPDIIHYFRHRDTVVKILLDSQQHNVDYQMSILMSDNNYYRWQVWFEEFIELDKYEENIVNKLENIAYEYWEEMEIYDENRLRRLIERLSLE